MFLLSACASLAAGSTAPTRPSMLTSAAPGDVVHYFGVGSNMLRSKIVSRGINGSSIEVLEMRPALVRGHRLAFNMRGLPPLEPGMGGIEESPAEECHGALCQAHFDELRGVCGFCPVYMMCSRPPLGGSVHSLPLGACPAGVVLVLEASRSAKLSRVSNH